MTIESAPIAMEPVGSITRVGFFVDHELGTYEVPVHMDMPHQDVALANRPEAGGYGQPSVSGVWNA